MRGYGPPLTFIRASILPFFTPQERGMLQHVKKENIKLLGFSGSTANTTRRDQRPETHFSFWSAIWICYIIIKFKFYFSLGPLWLKCTSEELLDTHVLHTSSLRLEGGDGIDYATPFARTTKDKNHNIKASFFFSIVYSSDIYFYFL